MNGKNYHNIEKYLSELRAKIFFVVFLNTTLKVLTTKKILTEKEEKKRKGREIRTEVQ